MKKTSYILGTLLLLTALVYGYYNNVKTESTVSNHNSKNIEETVATMKQVNVDKDGKTSILKGLEDVLNTIETLNGVLTSEPNNSKKINEVGKSLEINWDTIEKKVESFNKETYDNIERSLYPLMAEAQKKNPNVELMKQLVKETEKKITTFKSELTTN